MTDVSGRTLGGYIAQRQGPLVNLNNAGATRNLAITPNLQTRIGDAVQNVYGDGYYASVYSGGQPHIGSGGARIGSTRHDGGSAADLYVYNGNLQPPQRVTGDGLAPLAQHWRANDYGGVGLEMRGGGIHLDEHSGRGGNAWSYGSGFTPTQARAIADGNQGIDVPGAVPLPPRRPGELGGMSYDQQAWDGPGQYDPASRQVYDAPLPPTRPSGMGYADEQGGDGPTGSNVPAAARPNDPDPNIDDGTQEQDQAISRALPGEDQRIATSARAAKQGKNIDVPTAIVTAANQEAKSLVSAAKTQSASIIQAADKQTKTDTTLQAESQSWFGSIVLRIFLFVVGAIMLASGLYMFRATQK